MIKINNLSITDIRAGAILELEGMYYVVAKLKGSYVVVNLNTYEVNDEKFLSIHALHEHYLQLGATVYKSATLIIE